MDCGGITMARSLQSKVAAFAAAIGTTSLTALGIAALHSFSAPAPAIAQVFGQQEVDQSKYVVLATPRSDGAYGLLILEQISNQQQCWSESGANPVVVDPLLLKFDFTGICGRSTDSNGYSIRMAGRDFNRIFDLRLEKRSNDLVLVGVKPNDKKAPVIELGRANGLPSGGNFAKIQLNPGWRLTRRSLKDSVLGHVYLTSDTLAAGVSLPSAFPDTSTHWAKTYIDALAAQNIISGFPEDGSFRPEDPVTRVQFAAIVNKAFATAPAQRAAVPFKDVAANFWGLQAIQAAYQKGYMSGYPEGVFKPDQKIPRMQVLVSLASGLGLPTVDPNVLSFFQDAAQIPGWASTAVAAATDKQIVVNYPQVKQLNPDREATRAEVAAFVYQALAATGQMQAISSPYVVVVNAPIPGTTPQSPSFAPSTPTETFQSPVEIPPSTLDSPSPIAPSSPTVPVSPIVPASPIEGPQNPPTPPVSAPETVVPSPTPN